VPLWIQSVRAPTTAAVEADTATTSTSTHYRAKSTKTTKVATTLTTLTGVTVLATTWLQETSLERDFDDSIEIVDENE
jgi:hypothetical protein